MTVWTIDAEPASGGEAIARRLAERADVPLVDGQFAVAVALALGTTVAAGRELEDSSARGVVRYGLALGMSFRGAPELAAELSRIERCRSVVERAAQRAAQRPCVILGHCAYAALADHPGARHVSIRAPREWRARRLAAERCMPVGTARRELARADRRRRAAARGLAGPGAGDASRFHLVCDASRLTEDELVDVLLLLGGRPAAERLLHSEAAG